MLRKIAQYCLETVGQGRHEAISQIVTALRSREERFRRGQLDMTMSIANLRRNGFAPRSVVDGGAYVGAWTQAVQPIFPDARFLMIEANPEKAQILAGVVNRSSGNVAFTISLLGARQQPSVPFYLMETGSSVLPELSDFPRRPTTLSMNTIDNVAAEAALEGPIFLKLDVQGYELDVLRGGQEVLRKSEVVLLEVSLLEYNAGGPLFAEVIDFMRRRSFVPYDICGLLRRSSDRVASQADVIFVRTDRIPTAQA
jgi:FkbM family methyltransferase